MLRSAARLLASCRDRFAGRWARTAVISANEDWTCAVHPEVLVPAPGRCPVCDMKLLPLRRREGAPV